ncbi:hypothetical protein C0J52_17338 [Blattella germanica]|nr:hypothetical protein C0J52_17338 [Blattella germanica]
MNDGFKKDEVFIIYLYIYRIIQMILHRNRKIVDLTARLIEDASKKTLLKDCRRPKSMEQALPSGLTVLQGVLPA